MWYMAPLKSKEVMCFFLFKLKYSGSDVKESACNVGDSGSAPGWGRSPGEGVPTPVLLPGRLHRQRRLEVYSP